MNDKRNRHTKAWVALGAISTLVALSGTSCPTVADPITSASIVSASGGTVGFAQMTWSWTYAGPPNSVRPTSVDITIFRDGTNVMPGTVDDPNQPQTVSGTTTQEQIIIFRLFSGNYTIRFECTYPPGTLPETATYEFSESF